MLLSLLLTLYTIYKKKKVGKETGLTPQFVDPFFKNIRALISKLSSTLKKYEL